MEFWRNNKIDGKEQNIRKIIEDDEKRKIRINKNIIVVLCLCLCLLKNVNPFCCSLFMDF